MADPRTDFFTSGSDSPSDQDARTAFFSSNQTDEAPKEERENLFVGMGKYIAHTVAHAAGNLADVATGTAPGLGSHAEQWSAPFTDTDPRANLTPEQVRMYQGISHAYDTVAGTGPAAAEIKTRIPQALEAIGTVVPIVRGVGGAMTSAAEAPLSAQEILSRNAQFSPQSMGAAAAAPKVIATSPELQQAIVRSAQQTGGAINPEAVSRHIEADSLPVKIQLTPGQALQDPATISNEMNNRARTPGLPELLNRQNRALTENVQALRDQVGPDVFTTNHVEHGDTLIQAYKDKDAPIRADISAKYQALKDANGGEFPVDGQKFVANADRALKSNMKRPFLPAGVESTLQDFRNGESMSFENFENLRTTLASEARKAERSGDGNAAAAVNLVREQLENLPMSDVAAPVKALADQARSAAKARFDALRADPAYNAAVNDTVAPDDFVRKFVIGGKRDDVATMRENLSDNPTATQTMGVAALDHLRKAAGIDDMGNGTFSQAGYNKALQALGPKVNSLVDPKTSESLQSLGNVARYTQAQPKGAYVNNSNTLVAALGEHAMSAGENLLNAKTGIGGTLVRKAVENRALKKAAKETMTPYGGMTRLSDIPK